MMETFDLSSPRVGSHDGTGAGDHDAPYCFGRRPTAEAPFPFSTRQYARLLLLRSRARADLMLVSHTDTADPAVRG